MDSVSPPTLDAADLRLLALLQDDAGLSNQALAEAAHLSATTCHRRVQRLQTLGLIERRVAILNPQRLADITGWGLSALVEISLDVQTAEALDAFEAHALPFAEVQQLWRVSPGPDFILVLQVADMEAYAALAQRLFTAHANVRNVKAFFSIKRSKFGAELPLR